MKDSRLREAATFPFAKNSSRMSEKLSILSICSRIGSTGRRSSQRHAAMSKRECSRRYSPLVCRAAEASSLIARAQMENVPIILKGSVACHTCATTRRRMK